MSTSADERTPSASRSLKALNALGISTAGVRTIKTTDRSVLAELNPPTPPADLGRLEAIGYVHGAAGTAADLQAIAELGWIDLDHWISTELAKAMRAAARCLNGLSMVLAPPEARQLAHGAALARIDVLRSHHAHRRGEPEHTADPTLTGAPVGTRTGFHGGC